MQKDPYLILKVSPDANENEILEAYNSLKKQYSEERFLPGDEGRIAAENLTDLEQAYNDAMAALAQKRSYNNYGSKFGDIENMIKAGKLEAAQHELDEMDDRSAEWHYVQSIVFYRKNWYNECLKQLDFAIMIEPNNQKYLDAKARLRQVLYGPNSPVLAGPQGQRQNQYQNQNNQYQNQNQNQYQNQQQQYYQQRQMGGGMCGSEESCCLQSLLTLCCCQMMGGGCR